ncbi:MAG: hypothetical protein FWG61_01980, partial [Firmicutes bacterium]|nr:hypothetical protein [Bacillota bacterium]
PKAPPYTPPPVYTPPAEPKEIRSVPPKAPPYTPPPVYTPPTEPEVKETFLSENTPPRNQPPQYAPEINVELLQSLRPQNTPGQIKPSTNDPLHLLAMQAALETTIAKAEVAELEDNNFYADSRKQLAAAAERLQSGQLETLGGNEDDMQELTRQAHILAQQRLTRQQEITPAKDSAALMQRVAEETSAKDQIFKEQQLAERAIAAAMAAAKKAAQSAMTVSGHRNRQATSQSASQSAEQLIAAALSKASESNN